MSGYLGEEFWYKEGYPVRDHIESMQQAHDRLRSSRTFIQQVDDQEADLNDARRPKLAPYIYLMGSLRNPKVPALGNQLRGLGYEVFDDWFATGPETDDFWKTYEEARGRSYGDALYSPNPVAQFNLDLEHLNKATLGILVLPAGKSAHMELGYLRGRGAETLAYFSDGEPERWDIMYQFAGGVAFDVDSLIEKVAVLAPLKQEKS